MVEAGGLPPECGFLPGRSRSGPPAKRSRPRLRPHPAGRLVAVHARQADVQQHGLGVEGFRDLPARPAHRWRYAPRGPAPPASRARLSAESRLSSTTRTRRARAGLTRRPTPARSCAGSWTGGAGTAGRRTTNSLPRSGPSLKAWTRAAVHLDQAPDQGQADAQPALGAVERAVDLGEQVEDARQHLRRRCRRRCRGPGRPPRRRPAPPPGRSVRLPRCTWRRCSAGWPAPGRAAPGRPSTQTRLGGKRRRSSSCRRASISGRLVSTARGHGRGEVDRLGLQAGSCRAVIREMSSRSSTSRTSCSTWRSITSLAHCELSVVEAVSMPEDLHGVADRRQRVAQLVGQHGQELVLAAVASPGCRGRAGRCRWRWRPGRRGPRPGPTSGP